MTQDTHTVLTELKERMGLEMKPAAPPFRWNNPAPTQRDIYAHSRASGFNAAITRCISLVEEKLKANSKEV